MTFQWGPRLQSLSDIRRNCVTWMTVAERLRTMLYNYSRQSHDTPLLGSVHKARSSIQQTWHPLIRTCSQILKYYTADGDTIRNHAGFQISHANISRNSFRLLNVRFMSGHSNTLATAMLPAVDEMNALHYQVLEINTID